MTSEHRHHWLLHPDVRFLNHGSFGACPKSVLRAQTELRERMEREPVQFFLVDYPRLLGEARERLAPVLGASPSDFGFVRNATSGVNAVLRSLRFSPGDEIVTTDHLYGACAKALEHVARQTGARIVVAHLPFPGIDEDIVVSAIERCVTPRTTLALIDHVTSPTGLVLPIARIVAALDARGVDTLVDGAHAPGMIALDLDRIGAAYYAANFHKWLCTPKGAAMLHVRKDRQHLVHPTSISHPYDPEGRAFQAELDWPGTDDFTSYLAIPPALDFFEAMDGLPAVQAHNRALALEARTILCQTLRIAPPAPESMIGALASVPLPPSSEPEPGALERDPLHARLYERHHIELYLRPFAGARVLRVSAQLYNDRDDYLALAKALSRELGM